MAEFVTVIKELNRMCESLGAKCSGCKLSSYNNDYKQTCVGMVEDHPEETEKIVMKWAAEHPAETIADHFFKMFPNAPRNIAGRPQFCPDRLGVKSSCHGVTCKECWGRPWEGAADGN